MAIWISQTGGGGGGASNASSVSFTPTAGITSTNLQAALAEVDVKKLAYAKGILSARPASYAVNTLYVVSGDPLVANNGKAFIYDTVSAAWITISTGGSTSNLGTGTFAARPTAPGQNFIYVVSGDGTTSNNGKTYYYDLATTTWTELDTTINNRKIDDLLDVDTTTVAPISGDVLRWDSVNAKWVPSMGLAGSPIYTGALGSRPASYPVNSMYVVSGDVTASNNGKTFLYDTVSASWIELDTKITNRKIDDLADVDTTTASPTAGQFLSWNSVSSTWVPASQDPSPVYSGTLLARPASYANNSVYVVNGDSTAANNGRMFLYDTVLSTWIEIDTKITNRKIDDLADVDTTTTAPVLNDYLKWNGTTWVNDTLKEKLNINDLTDVDLSLGPATNNYSLMYNLGNSKWYAQQTVKSVNGVAPDALGNVTVAIAKVTTGTLAARPAAGSGSLINAEVYIVSGDSTAANNGRTFIYQLATTTWFEVNTLGGVGVSNIRVVSYLGSNTVGTGTFNSPYQTIQYAISQINFGTAAVIVVLPGTYNENITVSTHLNLAIAGMSEIVNANPVVINGSVTVSGTATRLRLTNMQITGTSTNPVPLTINGSAGRHVFQNVQFIPYTTSDSVTFTGTPQNFFTFMDCGFAGSGIVNMGTTSNTAACYFIRPITLYNLLIPSTWAGGISVIDCDYLGIDHRASAIGLFNCRSISTFNSSATSANGVIYASNCTTYMAATNTYTVINKTGTAPYRFKNFEMKRTGNTINGVELDTVAIHSFNRLSEIYDVDLVTSPPVNGNLLRFNGTKWVPGTSSAASINDLTDVDTGTVAPTVGQVLKWDGTNWVPGTGGSGTPEVLYGTLAARPVAPTSDTLYIVNGDGTATNNRRIYYYKVSNAAWVEIQYVKKDGDIMTGTLILEPNIGAGLQVRDFATGEVTFEVDPNLGNAIFYSFGGYSTPTTGDLTEIAGGTVNVTSGSANVTNPSHTTTVTPGFISVADASNLPPTLTDNKQLTHKKYVDDAIANQTLDNHSDVDLTTVAPVLKDMLTWNGTNWVPAQPVDTAQYTYEPTGFPIDPATGNVDRTSTSITFDNATRVFAISPTGSDFKYLFKNALVTKTSPQTVTIPNTTGNHFIYFDSAGTLVSTMTFSAAIITSNVYVASVYWNASTGSAVHFGDERHGCTMDGMTHAYLHTTIGSKYVSGMTLGTLSVDGNGGSNAMAQFSIDAGAFRDEDILHSLPAVGSTTSIPVLYRVGSDWYSSSNTFNFKAGASGRVQYNSVSGGVYSLTEAANNEFVLYHVIATNDPANPYVMLMGLSAYTNRNLARQGANTELASFTGLLFNEFVFVATVIYQTNSAFTNTAKAIIVSTDTGASYVDWRNYFSVNPSITLQNYATLDYVNGHLGTNILDLTTTPPVAGNFLKYDGTEWSNVAPVLDDMTDVDFTLGAATNNYALGYDSTSSKWFAQPFVKTINSVVPNAAGNITTPTIGTGLLSARPSTGLVHGQIYIVSGETNATNTTLNGRTYIYNSATTSWLELESIARGTTPLLRFVSNYGHDTNGNGSAASPYLTITKAISDMTVNGGTIVLLPGGYGETLNITNSNISIVGLTTANSIGAMTPSMTGSLTISGTNTRVNVENVHIVPAASSGIPLTITSTGGTFQFKNVKFESYFSTSNCVTFTGVVTSDVKFIDCNFANSGIVELNAASASTANITFERPIALKKLYVRSQFGSVIVKDALTMGVTHEASPLRLYNCQNINPLVSTAAASGTNFLYVENSSTYNAATNTYGIVNKSGAAPYTFKNFDIPRTGNTITGTETASPNSNRYVKLNELRDVDLITTVPTTGQSLKWDGTNWVPFSPVTNIDSLTDVDTTTTAPTSGQYLKFDGTNWVPSTVNASGNFQASTGTLAARPAAPTTNFFYIVSGNTPAIQNGRTFFYDLASTTWIELEPIISKRGLDDLVDVDAMTGLLGQVLMVTSGVYKFMDLFGTGTLAARPTVSAQYFLYVVTGDSTASNNGRAFLYSKAALAWVELDTKISNRSIDELKDVDTTTSAPVNNSLFKYNGTNWVPGQAYTGIASATPPAFNTVIPGTVWINSDTLEQFVYIVDGSSNNVWVSLGVPSSSALFDLADMSDVSITSPANGNYLYYDSAVSKWKNGALPVLTTGRNKIINGDMRISQKFKGGSVANDNYTFDYVVDKFFTYSFTSNGLYTSGRNLHGSLPGSGFDNYLGIRVGATGYDFAANATSYGGVNYMLEGIDVADLKLGTASAKPFTVSFWYYSSVAGTYNLLIRSRATGGTSWANNRFYIHPFTVPASTWTYVTATIPAVTSGANWTTNAGGMGLYLTWMLGAGSNYAGATSGVWYAPPSQFVYPYQTNTATQFLATANATMALTGVQLESGSTATAFEVLDYQTSLNKCKRFYFDYKFTNNSTIEPIAQGVVGSTATQVYAYLNFPMEMAKLPAVAMSGAIMAYDYTTGTSINVSSVAVNQYGKNSAVVLFTLASASTTGKTLTLFANTSNGVFSVDSNLLQGDA